VITDHGASGWYEQRTGCVVLVIVGLATQHVSQCNANQTCNAVISPSRSYAASLILSKTDL